MNPMTVGELRAAIANYSDDSLVFLCDDQGYPKWTYGAYQVQAVCLGNDDKCEIYIEALDE